MMHCLKMAIYSQYIAIHSKLKELYCNNITKADNYVVNDRNGNEIDFNKIIPRLSINEQEIINLRFYKDFSLNEISNIYKLRLVLVK